MDTIFPMDAYDTRILAELQSDARLSMSWAAGYTCRNRQ